MALATSTSTAKRLPVINDRCALRRNVAVQPYRRCSVCSLKLRQCHAWQSSAMSFALVVFMLVPLVGHEPWMIRLSVASSLILLLIQGVANHKRTDALIFGQHELTRASESLERTNAELEQSRGGLEREVAARTERLREANVALAGANLELAELARKREEMVLEVSHDLRTPLTSVKGAAENLLDGIAGPLRESQREYVEIVRDHAERLIAAINKLLDSTRGQTVRVALEPAPVDVTALTREVVRGLQPIAEERGVTLEVKGNGARTVADPDKLRQVVENLVGNALKFTDRGGSVVVSSEEDDANVLITVDDTGVGMAPADLEHVFDRFYRARADGEERPGSGLGLAITRDLVRLHGGDVLARSALGKGSTFSALLPRRAA
jgi:signal transduction histidine kinase